MNLAEFSNALRLLHGIDAAELVGVQIQVARAFVDDPVRQFIRADDATAGAIWDAMQKRCAPTVRR